MDPGVDGLEYSIAVMAAIILPPPGTWLLWLLLLLKRVVLPEAISFRLRSNTLSSSLTWSAVGVGTRGLLRALAIASPDADAVPKLARRFDGCVINRSVCCCCGGDSIASFAEASFREPPSLELTTPFNGEEDEEEA